MKKDIFFEGRIYKDYPADKGYRSSDELLKALNLMTNYEVQKPHPFKDGEDVTGRYELEYQVDQFEFWNRSTKYEYDRTKEDLRRIVAIPTPLPVNNEKVADKAKDGWVSDKGLFDETCGKFLHDFPNAIYLKGDDFKAILSDYNKLQNKDDSK